MPYRTFFRSTYERFRIPADRALTALSQAAILREEKNPCLSHYRFSRSLTFEYTVKTCPPLLVLFRGVSVRLSYLNSLNIYRKEKLFRNTAADRT